MEELSALLPKEQLYRLYEQATREPYSFLFVYYLNQCSTSALKSVLHLKKTPMGAALSFLGQKLFASTLINAKCEAAVQPPIVRRTGGFLKKRMTAIYVDSCKRVAGLDSDFEVDLGESLHWRLQLSPEDHWIFFHSCWLRQSRHFCGKNPNLGAGSAGGFYAGQVARPGFYAGQECALGIEAGRAIKRGWASQYSLGEPVLGKPSNKVGRASTKGPLGKPVLIGRTRTQWASHQTRLGQAIKRGWVSQY